MGRDSSVGIATRYGLDDPGIESRWGGVIFSAPVHTGPGAHPASYTMGNVSFSGVKRPGPGVDHRLPFSADVKERVELYFYSTFGPSWPVLGRTFYLYLYLYVFRGFFIYVHFVLISKWLSKLTTVFARVICALFFSILAAEKSWCVKYADFFFCGGLDLCFILV